MTDASNLHFDAKSVAAWISRLPLANIGKSAQLVFDYLGKLIAAKLNPIDSFEHLEQLQSSVAYLRNQLSRHYLGSDVISRQKKATITQLALSLENRYATAYAAILSEILKQPEKDKLLFAQATIRSLIQLNQVMLIHYQLYLSLPANFWKKLNHLYLQAERLGIQEITPLPNPNSQENLLSVQLIYLRCLLLAAANPACLRFREIAKLNELLDGWFSLVTLEKAPFDDCTFIIDLVSDSGPTYLKQSPLPEQVELFRALNTNLLVEHMRDLIKQHDSPEQVSSAHEFFSRRTIRYLKTIWGHPFTRKYPRIESKGVMKVCLTLFGIHYYLSGKKEFLATDQFKPLGEGRSSLMLAEDEAEDPGSASAPSQGPLDPWDIFSDTSEEDNDEKDPQKSSLANDNTRPEKYPQYSWTVINSSIGGYCLYTDTPRQHEMQPGELIGVQHPEQEYSYQWAIGCIQWVYTTHENQSRFGVKLLASSGTAVTCRLYEKKDKFRGLLLNEVSDLNKVPSILLPPLNFKIGDSMTVSSPSLELEIRLAELLFNNSSYCQFRFDTLKVLKEDITLPDNLDLDQDSDKDLNNIWDEIY